MSEHEAVADYTDAEGGLGYDEWRAALRDGVLLGMRCEDCDEVVGTPKAACPACGARALTAERLPQQGTVRSETTIGVPPEGVEERGYTVAVVALGDAGLMARVGGDVEIGDRVVFDGVRDGERPAPVFEPDG